MRKLNTEEFIRRSREIHGYKYDYSKTEYINSNTKVKIICPEHGGFEQVAYSHLAGRKCKECGYEERNLFDDKKEFLKKANKVHKSRYDYSKVDYKRSNSKVEIICKEHGVFLQTPNKHLLGQGCRKCGYLSMSGVPQNLFRNMKKLKRAISSVYYRGTYTKNCMIHDILDCDWESFKEHLENNPYGFKVGDKDIDLDHIIPISSATTEKELYKLNHYSNFQLLPSFYNRYIKKNKILNKNHFKEWWKNQEHSAYKNQKTL